MIGVIITTLKGMFLTALTAAVSENLVLVRAFGLGELDYAEYTPTRAFRGAPILFIYLGLLSLALFGLVGHQLAL